MTNTKLTVYGVEFREYPVDRLEMRVIISLLDKPRTIIDVGANIGWYTMILGKTYPTAKIYSFEPMSKTIEYLKKNLYKNKIRAEVFPYALSDKTGTATFNYYPDFPAASSLKETINQKPHKVKVELKRLDDFKFENVDFIKVDTEGSELFVLKGAIETIKKYKPIVFSEMLTKWSKKFGYHPNDIINLFKSLDYECYVINKDKLEKFGIVDDKTRITNYLFFHKEKHKYVNTSL